MALDAMNTGSFLKPVHFHVSAAKNYAAVEHQIVEHLRQELAQAGVAVSQSRSVKQGALTISCFIRQKADIYIGHNLADKNYLLLRDENGQAYINHFQHVFVQGHWLRRRLLGSRHCHLKPYQIHVIGAPRVDYLRELATGTPTPSAKRQVLWAPAHDKWMLRGDALSAYPALEAYLDHELIADNKNLSITRVPHPRNRENKQAITQELLSADVVISDYSSVIYEAWALGKPVIFPRWLLGDKVLEKAPDSAEAHIYRESLGYHPQSVEELSVLLESELTISDEVTAFMQDYVHNFSSSGVAKQVSTLLERIASSDFIAQQEAHYAQLQAAIDAEDWGQANTELSSYVTQYNQGLPLPDTQRVSSYQQVIAKATTKRAMAEYKAAVAEKRWLDAENAMRDLLAYVDDNAQVYNRLAEALRKQGKWWQEVEALKSAIALEDQHPSWHYRLGEAEEVMNRFQAAAASYGQAIALKGGKADAQWYYRQGYAYARKGHDGEASPNAAEHAYQQAMVRDTKLNAQRFGIGVFHQLRGHWVQAKKVYKQHLLKSPTDAELYYRLAMAHDRCYEWSEAEAYYKKALSIEFDRAAWHYRLGFVLERQNKLEDARLAYQYVADNSDDHSSHVFYRLGFVLEGLGSYKEAVKAYLKSDPEYLDETGNERYSESNLENIDDLESIYKKQFPLGEFVVHSLGAYLDRNTCDVDRWIEKGRAHESNADWLGASKAYLHALKRKNEYDSGLYYRLGFVLANSGEYKDAAAAFRNTRILQKEYGVSVNKFDKNPGFRQASTYTEYYNNLNVVDNIVLYESFHGQGLTCNPYGIFLEFFNDKSFERFLHVWVVNDLETVPTRFKSYKNIVFVRRDSDLYLRYLTTAKILINNSTFPPYYIRKESQIYLNTWHGTPLKTLGKDMEGRFFEHKNFTRNILQSTALLSPNHHTSKIFIDKHDIKGIYTGDLIESGYPRIDLTLGTLLTGNDVHSLKENNKKIIFYAPTWRGTHGDISFDVDKLRDDISKLTALPDCTVYFRGHSLMKEVIESEELPVNIVPSEIDTNEFLSITDILITDYSSILFDFLPLNRPIALYQYDYDEYLRDRGLYLAPDSMPGTLCKDIDSLCETVALFLMGKEVDYSEFIDEFCHYDHGKSSSRLLSYLIDGKKDDVNIVNDVVHNKKSLLFYGGPFMANGITTSYVNLVNSIDRNNCDVSLVIDPGSIEKEEARLINFHKMPSDINCIARVGRMNVTIEEDYLHSIFNRDYELVSHAQYEVFERSWLREYKRVFGNANIDRLVQFEGYNKFWAGLFAYTAKNSAKQKSFIYQHNDKNSEYTLKYPYLKSLFYYSAFADRVVSVSKPTMLLNRDNLSEKFVIPKNNFVFCDNLQNIEYVVNMSKRAMSDEDQALFDRGKITFATMGRLSVEKDHQKLIDGFSLLHKKYSNVQLVILGDGPLRVALIDQVRKLGLEDDVHLLGQRENPFPLLSASDCFVLSSNHEGQPMVLFEAMILKKPIISTDIVGSRSAIEGRSGHLVDNSVEGLAKGMEEFINGDLIFSDFDVMEYQEEASNMFYEKVVECGEASSLG